MKIKLYSGIVLLASLFSISFRSDDQKQLKNLINLGMSDEVSSWHLGSDGVWVRKSLSANGEKLADLQDQMMFQALSKKRIR